MYTLKDRISFGVQKIRNNKVAKVFFCYLFSFAFVKGTSFLLIPLYANFMEKAEYGHFAFLITLLSLFSLLTDLGLNNGLYRYIKYKKRDPIILCSVLIMSFAVNLFTYISVLILISWLKIFPYEVSLFHLTILFSSLVLSSFTMLNLTYFRIYNKGSSYLICTVSQPLFHIGIFSFLIYMEKVNISNLLLSTLISNIITVCLTIYLNKKDLLFVVRIKMMKRLIKYTFGTTISILALYVLTGLDRFFLAYYLTPESLADYSLLMLFASITILLMEPISLWYFANRFNMLKNKIRFERVTSYLVVLNIWIATFIVVNGAFIFDLLLPDNYYLDFIVFLLAVLSFHIKYLSTILNIGCYTNKNTNIVAKINVSVAALTFILFLLIAKEHNTFGVVGCILFGYATILCLNLYFSQKREPIKYKKNEIIINYIGSFMVVFIMINYGFNVIFSNALLLSIIFVINVKGLRYVKHSENKTKDKKIKQLPL